MNTNLRRHRAIFVVFCLLCLSTSTSTAENEPKERTAWALLSEGSAIAIMRHTLAPGTGDPAHFKVDDCSTQRLLSDEGRTQARSAGRLFQANGISQARVFSSQWCRCEDTATLLGIGEVTTLPSLNSFFRDRSTASDQTDSVRSALPDWMEADSMPTVLVTHQVNISALTGQFTRSGEILIITIEDNDVSVLASISTL